MTYRDDHESLQAKLAELETLLDETRREVEHLRAEHREASDEAREAKRRLRELEWTQRQLRAESEVATEASAAVDESTAPDVEPPTLGEAASTIHAAHAARAARVRSLLPLLAVPFVVLTGSAMFAAGVGRHCHSRGSCHSRGAWPTVDVTWSAEVVSAEHVRPALAAHDACTVSAALRRDPQGRGLGDVNVVCGRDGDTESLYGWDWPLERGLEMRDCLVHEERDERGQLRYMLECHDESPRGATALDSESGRPYLTLDTTNETLVLEGVTQADGTRPRIVLRVDRLSSAWAGAPLWDAASRPVRGFRASVNRTGTVTAASGLAPVALGSACTLRVVPTGAAEYPCRALLRCDGELLYGARGGGMLACEHDALVPTRGLDSMGTPGDRDPFFELDLPANIVRIGDREEDGRWALTVALDPAP